MRQLFNNRWYPQLTVRLLPPKRLIRRVIRCVSAWRLFLCLFSLLPTVCSSFSYNAEEQQIKAAFLYNFTRFISWPNPSNSESVANFKICVIGHDPFGDALTPLEQRSRNGQRIIIRYINTIPESLECKLLYIGITDPRFVNKILASLSGKPILTVSSLPDFVNKGGVIGFVNRENHVRFEINRNSCSQSGLICSAKLLEAATLVVEHANSEENP